MGQLCTMKCHKKNWPKSFALCCDEAKAFNLESGVSVICCLCILPLPPPKHTHTVLFMNVLCPAGAAVLLCNELPFFP